MAPHLRSVSPPHRGVAWAIAVIALSLCASSWSASEPDTTRKARKRPKARPALSAAERPAPTSARVTQMHACHDAQGRTEYRQHPCPDGGRRLLGHDDPREASQIQHSAAMAQREKALLHTMTRDRERQARLDIQARTPKPTKQAQQPRKKEKEKEVDEGPSDRARRGKREPALPRYRSLTPLTADTPQERAKL